LYYFWIKSVNIYGESDYSDSVSGTPASAITTPEANTSYISFSNITSSSVILYWDAVSNSEMLYSVYYSSSDNISSIRDLDNGNSVVLYESGITSSAISGLDDGTSYYVYIVVSYNELSSIYLKSSFTTLDITSPYSGGELSASAISSSSVYLSWSSSSDNLTSAENLQYGVYYSTASNIDTVSNIISNGIISDSYTENITSKTVSDLNNATTYYFNVIVIDQAGNQSCYTQVSVSTL
ncbi:MAG: hypothetical protein PQJ46_17255, partial [Spirochaetales bacterium]|nr:hypothetical protein [Spirochaetales bacterium]